jgi:sugar transferase (PEP-CTERM system associated)
MLRILNQYISVRVIFLVVTETLLLLGSLFAVIYAMPDKEAALSTLRTGNGLLKALFVAAVFQFCLYFNDLYDLRLVRQREEIVARLLQAFGMACILLAVSYYIYPSLAIGRHQGIFILGVFIFIIVIVVWRYLFGKISKIKRLKARALIIGSGKLALNCAKELLERDELGLEIVGFIDNNPSKLGTSLINPKLIGTIDDLTHIVNKYKVDKIIVALEDRRSRLPFEELLDLKFKGVLIDEAISVYEKITGKIYVGNLYPSWLIFSDGFKKSDLLMFGKRMFDIFFSVCGLIICLPIALTIALLIKLDSRGPVLFKQERMGANGKIFNILKFRSMRYNAEEDTGPIWAKDEDDRITRIGGFLRFFRLDEIPQFINILRGDMSLVGPRPERPYFVDQLKEQIKYYDQRHSVKPGITGWAQVKYKYGSSVNDALEKLQYDLFYIKNMSLLFDLAIILLSIKIVLSGKGAK